MYNFIDDLLEKGEKRGLEKGKKIAIYEAHLRGGSIDLLSNLFALTAAEIHQIVKEMKKEMEEK